MIFSKTTGYGIRALAYLAKRDNSQLCGLSEIARQERIPPVFLRKILGELRRHRLLRSVKGIHGGYQLLREPETITLWEVYTILDPNPYFDQCILGHGVCQGNDSCVLHEDWQRIRKDFIGLLQAKTIAQIAKSTLEESTDWREAFHLQTCFDDKENAI